MNEQFIEDLNVSIDYLWDDEQRNWEEDDQPENHVFLSLKRVKEYLDKKLQLRLGLGLFLFCRFAILKSERASLLRAPKGGAGTFTFA